MAFESLSVKAMAAWFVGIEYRLHMLSLFILKQPKACVRMLPNSFWFYFRAGLQTISAPFSSAAFTVFNSGLRKSSSAKLKALSSCHSAPGSGSGRSHSFIAYASRSVRRPRLIHSMYLFSSAKVFYLIGTGVLNAVRPASVMR
jgi:hypothetical protein